MSTSTSKTVVVLGGTSWKLIKYQYPNGVVDLFLEGLYNNQPVSERAALMYNEGYFIFLDRAYLVPQEVQQLALDKMIKWSKLSN